MTSLLEESHGIPRPSVPRIGVKDGELRNELPPTVEAVLAAADRDPRTGRFVRENRAARRRRIKAIAKDFVALDPARCAPWLAPHVARARTHAAEMIAALPVQRPELVAIAADAAAAQAIFRALLQLGAEGDAKALSEARAWMREHRQSVITVTALSRDAARAPADEQADWWAASTPEKDEDPADEETDPAVEAAPTAATDGTIA